MVGFVRAKPHEVGDICRYVYDDEHKELRSPLLHVTPQYGHPDYIQITEFEAFDRYETLYRRYDELIVPYIFDLDSILWTGRRRRYV